MAKHEFGMMQHSPMPGERYDEYDPERYGCISVDDDFIEPILQELLSIDFFWHTPDVSGKGLAYCGITLISPDAAKQMTEITNRISELQNLTELLNNAAASGKFIIHFGL